VDGKPFEFVGGFIPGWFWGAAGPANDRLLLSSAKQAGFSVLHVMPPLVLSSKCDVYVERQFVAMDQFLDEAARQQIRVLIPFIHGLGMTESGYTTALYSPYGIESLVKDPKSKACFVDYVQAVANRVNSVNGRRYSADPTILGWDIIEEPISGEGNYPIRPPAVTLQEVRAWFTEMSGDIKAVDPNHLVGVEFTSAAIDGPELDDPSASVLNAPGLDFIEIEDGDVRVLQAERSNHIYDAGLATGKPTVIFIAFTGLSYPDPGETKPNDQRLATYCADVAWQAKTFFDEFLAYHQKGAAGYVMFSWRAPGIAAPAYDSCFSYSTDSTQVVDSFRRMSEFLGPLNTVGSGPVQTRAGPAQALPSSSAAG
jgi:hypothetical protein